MRCLRCHTIAMLKLSCVFVMTISPWAVSTAAAQNQPVLTHVQDERRPRTIQLVEQDDAASAAGIGSQSVVDLGQGTTSVLDSSTIGDGSVPDLIPASPLGEALGLGVCCNDAPWPGYGVTYVVGTVPNHLFNVGAGAALGRSTSSTSVLPFPNAPNSRQVLLPIPGDGGPLGAVRITDNNSAFARNRLFIDYAGLDDIDAIGRQYDSHRAVAGLERRFTDPIYGTVSSMDVRVPFGLTLSPNSIFGPNGDSDSSEMGNILFGMKTQLQTGPGYAVSFGLSATIPTADDFTFRETANSAAPVLIRNKSVRLTPYLAATWHPAPYRSMHLFYSIDVDATGSPVFMDTDVNGQYDAARTLHGTTMHSLDISYIAWLWRNDFAPTGYSGFAWYAEYHYSSSLESPDSFVVGNFRVGNPASSVDMSNIAFGGHFKFANDKLLTVGYAVPIGDRDAVFDGELRLIFNKYF